MKTGAKGCIITFPNKLSPAGMRRRIYAGLRIPVRRRKGYEHAGRKPGMRMPAVLRELPGQRSSTKLMRSVSRNECVC